jgi:hypothetical protein
MEQELRSETKIQLRWIAPAGLIAAMAVVAALLLLSAASAQETPAPTDSTSAAASPGAETPATTPGALETPTVVTDTLVRIEVDQAVQPVSSGDEFEVRVMVDNVEHLSAFDFVLQYDPDRLEPVEDPSGGTPAAGDAGGLGAEDVQIAGRLAEFIETSPSGESSTCQGPYVREQGFVLGVCVSLARPLCLDGPEGATGSGVLARIQFKSRGGEMTNLRLASSNLVSDDVEPPCDPEDFRLRRIPHRVQDTTVLLAGGGGGAGVLIGVIIGVVVVALLAGGGGVYVWYRRRSASGV